MSHYPGTTGDDGFVGTNDDVAVPARGGRDRSRGPGGDDYVSFGAANARFLV